MAFARGAEVPGTAISMCTCTASAGLIWLSGPHSHCFQWFPRLVGPRGNTHGSFIQSDRTGLNQSDRTGIGQLLPGPRTKNNWQRLKGKVLDLEFAHGESSISCLEWAGIK